MRPRSSFSAALSSPTVSGCLLAALLLWVILAHGAFARFDGRSLPDHDYFNARPFLSAYGHTLQAHSFHSLTESVRSYRTYYLHHTYFLALPAYFAGIDFFRFHLFGLPFYLLMILGAYATGRLLAHRSFGLLCAFIVATLPLYDNFSRKTDLQFFVAVYLVWANFFVLKILTSPWKIHYSLLFGLSAGLAIVAHPIALLLLPPLFIALLLHLAHGRGLYEKRGVRFVLAIAFTLLFASPFLFKSVDYVMEKRAFVSAALNGSLAGMSAADRAHLWLDNNCWDFLGPWFAAFFALVLLAALVRLVLATRRDAVSWYTIALSIYYPAGSLYTTINGAMTYDFIAMQVLLLPLLLREAYLLLTDNWAGKGARLALIAGVCLALVGGTIEKNSIFQPLREDAPPDAYPNHLAHRRIQYRLDLSRQTIENLLRLNSGQRVSLRVQHLTPTAAGGLAIEPPTDNDRQIFYLLEATAALYDVVLLEDEQAEAGWRPFELVYYRLPQPAGAKNVARAILALRAAWDDGRTLDWSYAARRGTHATMPVMTDAAALMAVRRVPEPQRGVASQTAP
ncbi:MAG TPA: glycosyltransferase family 39 protein [bacterium]|nr:glycosyltransferase family 39 protein [bacterium]